MKDPAIREAQLRDAIAIASLVSQLGYPTSPEAMADRLAPILGIAEYVVFVAEVPQDVAGLGGARLDRCLEFSGLYGRLLGLVVDQAWQGKGVGRSLLEHIEAWLIERGATHVTLTRSSHRRPAHEFYRHLGYEETGLRFAKLLVQPADSDT